MEGMYILWMEKITCYPDFIYSKFIYIEAVQNELVNNFQVSIDFNYLNTEFVKYCHPR